MRLFLILLTFVSRVPLPLPGSRDPGCFCSQLVVTRWGQEPAGGVRRNPHTGVLCPSSAPRKGHMQCAHLHQHMCHVSAQGTPWRLRVKGFGWGCSKGSLCQPQPNHQNSRLSEKSKCLGLQVGSHLIRVGNTQLSRCQPRASPANF